ncbi:TPT-domain-containing protein [Microthyrium microscopicum]|uniref:TPT-domain-containing protein n=1 Tax=Microthyrium microscopicum TaxID=703497 RepID=A0A6A6UH86_9PEZI|nr:TPT-domain-containing protein [Microthyrium microscopicum]
MASSPGGNGTIQFPAFSPEYDPRLSADAYRRDDLSLQSHEGSPVIPNGQQWMPRRSSTRGTRWTGLGINTTASSSYGGGRHKRQKSLTEAFHNIRTRRSGSVSQNAMEIAEALKAPVSPALVALFSIWYFASVMSSTSSKQILLAFPKPVTLTILQFAFVSSWCLFLSWLSSQFPWIKRRIPALKNGIKKPSRSVIMTTLPITGFMIGGHILSSDAISRMDVSLVHTIKGLSPLFTVVAYRFIYGTKYSTYTYLSLVPLMLGVVLACSTNFRANFLGFMSAFASAILFVTQNMVSKKIFNDAEIAEKEPNFTRKPDKLNLLCYSSLLALLFTAPIWLWSEGWHIIVDFFSDASIELTGKAGSFDHGRLALEYIFNGTFHFTQSLAAFVLLSMVSPVTYSVASLVKRVFVILFSVMWFGNRVTKVQWLGIALTFLGLYLYDRTSDAEKADRRARNAAQSTTLLPLVEKESPPHTTTTFPRQPLFGAGASHSKENGHHPNINGWLPSGTKAEETWNRREVVNPVS